MLIDVVLSIVMFIASVLVMVIRRLVSETLHVA